MWYVRSSIPTLLPSKIDAHLLTFLRVGCLARGFEVRLPSVPIVMSVVRYLALGVISVDLALVVYILYRRASRNFYYRQKDAAQKKFAGTIDEYLAGNVGMPKAVNELTTRRRAQSDAVRSVLLATITSATRQRATDLLIALGFVQRWTQRAFGIRRARQLLRSGGGKDAAVEGQTMRNGFLGLRRLRVLAVARAIAVNNLGRLSQEFSGLCMREALHDPSPEVGRLTVGAMGRNPFADGVPILLEELRKAAEGQTTLPVRSIKTALVRHPIEELRHFTPVMEYPNSRFRFLAVDTVREICRITPAEKLQAFPAELRSWFLAKAVHDESPDVRARSAAVIGYLRDQQSISALGRLLEDQNEFVRLHAVRVCADPYYSGLIADVALRVTDQRWRVREAAVRTLASFQASGRRPLEALFVATSDRYASEQIADEFQRSGMILQMVPALVSSNGERQLAAEVCAKMVRLGMDSLLIELLADEGPPEVRARLLELLSASENPEFLPALQRLAAAETGLLKQKADALLSARLAKAAAAAGEYD